MARGRLATASLLLAIAGGAGCGGKARTYQVVHQLSLAIKTTPPTFVSPEGLTVLDRGGAVHIGRPLENRSVLRLLDLSTFQTRDVQVPGIPGPWTPTPNELVVDKPLFYDTANRIAGLLLRAGATVNGDAAYAEWDLRMNRVTRRLPLEGAAGASVRAIGYDPARREAYLEIAHSGPVQPCESAGHNAIRVVAIGEGVRTVAAFEQPRRATAGKGPYYDPRRRRSMHVDYAECGPIQTHAVLVDLDSGKKREFALPKLIYGFAFDPDGRMAYAYSWDTGEVLALDLETGVQGARRKIGTGGHALGFLDDRTLLLARNEGLHLLEARTLEDRGFIPSSAIHQGPMLVEGTRILPGRALVRASWSVYVVDFAGTGSLAPGSR